MHKITEVVIEHFMRREAVSSGNTSTDGTSVSLFGNKIIERTEDGDYMVTLAGWETDTTRNRINGFFEFHPTFSRVGLKIAKDKGDLVLHGDFIAANVDDVDNRGRMKVGPKDVFSIYTAAGGVVKVERVK